MSIYLLTNPKIDELETVIFTSDDSSIVIMFTDPTKAEKYLKESGWQEQYTVATLNSIECLEWMLKCYRSGVKYLATNPTRAEQDADLSVDALDIESQLMAAGDHIRNIAQPDF